MVVRAAAQGLLGPAVVAFVLTAAGLWLAPARWKGLAGVVAAAASGTVVLTPSFGLAMGAFVAAGVIVTGRVGGEPIVRDARLVAAIGLTAGSLLLLTTPLVAVPTVVAAGAVVLAVVTQRLRPVLLQRAVDRSARRLLPLSSAAHARCAPLATRWRGPTTSSSRWMLAICGLAAAVGVALAIRDQRLVLIDDAAITFRYATRIASGDGFTYNDGDRTNGASAPLYTLLLAVGRLVGWEVEAFARSIGVACYAATAAFVTAIVGRARGLVPAAAAAVLVLSSQAFRTEALTGMESGFAAMLGVLTILLLVEGRTTWAGVVLGFAVVNKLDAGFLALAVGAAWMLVHRTAPWRLAVTAALTSAPWFAFSLFYFGSLLPFSATQKIGGEVVNPENTHDPLWIGRRIASDRMALLLVLGLVIAALVAIRVLQVERRLSLTMLSCGFWVALHGAAFSLINLGDPYPWYTTVLFPPLIVAGVLAVTIATERLAATVPPDRLAGVSRRAVTHGLTAGALLLVLVSVQPGIDAAVRVAQHGHHVTEFELFEDTRRQAGRFTGDAAEPDEVVQSCYGWVAFGALDNPFRETCPLSTQIDPGPPTWIINTYLDGQRRDTVPLTELVRVFDSPLGATYVYRLDRDDSEQQILCRAAEAITSLQDLSIAQPAEMKARFTEALDAAAALSELQIPSLDQAATDVRTWFERAVAEGNRVGWSPEDPVTKQLAALTTGDARDAELIRSITVLVDAAGNRC